MDENISSSIRNLALRMKKILKQNVKEQVALQRNNAPTKNNRL